MEFAPVTRIGISTISDFQRQVTALGQPVVIITDAYRSAKVASWTLSDLARRFGSVRVPVWEHDDDGKRSSSSTKGGEAGPRRMMVLADYLRLIGNRDAAAGGVPYAANINIRDDPAVASRLAPLLSECRFPESLPSYSKEDYKLWIGAAGQSSIMHNDPYHNFNAQIVGSKRFVLFPPEQHDVVYAQFVHQGIWVSQIDPANPGLANYPLFAQACGLQCDLAEGEILYIPRFWWHHVRALTVSVNLNRFVYTDTEWWHQRPEARRFVSYEKLLAHVRREFETLAPLERGFRRAEFDRLRSELEALLASVPDDSGCPRSST